MSDLIKSKVNKNAIADPRLGFWGPFLSEVFEHLSANKGIQFFFFLSFLLCRFVLSLSRSPAVSSVVPNPPLPVDS